MDEFNLEKRVYAALQKMSPDALVEMQYVDVALAHAFEGMVLRMKRIVWSHEIDRKELEFPRDWWQAVRARFAPRWWLKRWPVIYATLDVRVYHAYPEYKVNKERPHLQVDIERVVSDDASDD